MTEWYEDWSRCRSKSRAIRRMKQGHWQNMIYKRKPVDRIVKIGDSHLVGSHSLLIIKDEMANA
jgi:hypothetical protein